MTHVKPAYAETFLDLVGHTPLVEITRLNPRYPDVHIFAKIESCNPGGSVKDRIAKSMIEAAEADGQLTPERILIEPTSGNTGIGLALIAAAKGYRFISVMPESASLERRKVMSALGAELILTNGQKGTNYSIEVAHRLLEEHPEYLMLDQFNNPANVAAHYDGTGVEILEQAPGADFFVAGMGTGGTLMGVGRRLREARPAVSVIGLEPMQGSQIQGLRCMGGYVPGIFSYDELDETIMLEDEGAFETARQLARVEGLLVGISSGAALWGALRVAEQAPSGATIVTLFPDGGERYLSTPLYGEPPLPKAIID